MSDLIELKPCPFCGTVPTPENAAGSYVFCHGCAAEGPVANADKNGGAREWNTRALIDTTAERDALRKRVARLESALALYSCEDGCNDCPEHERDRVSCGWTALTALQEDTPNE